MQEELNEFKRNDGVNIIGTKWVYRNKSDESSVVTRNKAKLVAQGYPQIEGVDFDETFAPIARLESIRLLLGVACILKFKLFQIDVKSAFLNGYLNEEVYVAQPKGFVDPNLPDHVYRLKKALYGLKQAEPKMSHLTQVKRILKHVNGTSDYGILYSHDEDSRLIGYCDADWAGSADYRKITSVGSSCSQLLWMKQMLSEYNVEQDVLTLYCDKTSAINISKNPIQHSRTKQIDVRHHFIRDLVEDKVVTLEYVATNNQLADIFTKFETLRGKLGICLLDDQ
ncbi:secreted RxLR effector protein [Trifolium repens]|nr:secreted RxLR effector protein [Trifolium repens]